MVAFLPSAESTPARSSYLLDADELASQRPVFVNSPTIVQFTRTRVEWLLRVSAVQDVPNLFTRDHAHPEIEKLNYQHTKWGVSYDSAATTPDYKAF